MAKQRRNKLPRALYTIPGVATEAYPIAQIPRVPFIFGTTIQPQPVHTPSTLPPLPQSVIENIIDHLHDRPVDLQSCCLVSSNWKTQSRIHLFRKVQWNLETVSLWCKSISPRSEGPAGFTKILLVTSLLEYDRLRAFKTHFTSFRNVTYLTLRNLNFDDQLFNPDQLPVYFGHLKSGLKSLTLTNANGSCGQLHSFASFFLCVESLTISRPGELIPPDPAIGLRYRPLRGTLFLRGSLHRHADFIKLLSRAPPPKFHTVRLEHWGRMRVEEFDTLLKSCSGSLEVLDVSACKGWYPVRLYRSTTILTWTAIGGADEPFSKLRPNFSLSPRLTEFRIELQHIGDNPPSLINTLLTSPIALSRITFVICRRVEPEDLSYAKTWAETDIIIARFATKFSCRGGGKRLLLTFKATRTLDYTKLVPRSVERGVEVVVERGDDEEFASLPACVSCRRQIT